MPDLAGVYRGVAGVREFWREWLAAWGDLQFEYELADAGDRVVILVGDQRMRGRFTDIEVGLGRHAEVVTFRDGLLIHWKLYRSQSRALKAVGLAK